MAYKSPFLIVKDLISPLQCEDTIRRLKHISPNIDQGGHPTVTYKGNVLTELRITPEFLKYIPTMEAHYGFEYKTLTPFVFEWYPMGFPGQKAGSEGNRLVTKRGEAPRWQRTKDYDFTVVVFLNDYSDKQTFDERFEARGGKLEFPTHDFGFNPIRGTAIMYPCCPNFINAVGPVDAGDSTIIRFNIVAKEEYKYDMDNFPGGYKEWFAEKE